MNRILLIGVLVVALLTTTAITFTVTLENEGIHEVSAHGKKSTITVTAIVTGPEDFLHKVAAFMELLDKGEFEAAVRFFDETMREGVPAPKLRIGWAGLVAQFGQFKSLGESRVFEEAGFQIVLQRVVFERGELNIRVAFDKAGLIAGLHFSPPDPIAEVYVPPDYVVEEVFFTNDDITLAGTLTLPPTRGPHPAVILISGSGPQNRDHEIATVPGYRPFAVIADKLTRHGIAVLRYDDRGVGESTGDPAVATSADFAADVEAALRYLRGREEISPEWIGLLGFSEGGMIAAMVAARTPEVAFVISMAGPAVDGYNAILMQVEHGARLAGGCEQAVAEALEQQRIVLDLTLAGEWEDLQAFLHEIILGQLQALPKEKQAALGDLKVVARRIAAMQLETFQSPWYQFFLRHDPGQDWERVKVPVLALFGELDVQVDVAQNRPALEEALARAGNDDLTVVVFPTANHLFQDAVTGCVTEYARLPVEFLPGFLEAITRWLLERVALAN